MGVHKRWEYTKNQNCALDVLVRVIQVKSCFHITLCGLDGCKEVHHRLLHRQAANRNSTVNKILSDATNLHQVVMLITMYLNSKNMLLMLIKVLKQQVSLVRERLLIEMKMPQ